MAQANNFELQRTVFSAGELQRDGGAVDCNAAAGALRVQAVPALRGTLIRPRLATRL